MTQPLTPPEQPEPDDQASAATTAWWESSPHPGEGEPLPPTPDHPPTPVEDRAPTAPLEPLDPAEAAEPAPELEPVEDRAPTAPLEPLDPAEAAEPAPEPEPGAADEPVEPPTPLVSPIEVADLPPSRNEAQTPPDGTPVLELSLDDKTRKLPASSAPGLSLHYSSQGLAAMAVRDRGRVRESNQDSVFSMLLTLPREGGDLPVGLFVVADGMGGHQGGEVASRLAVRTVVHQVLAQLVLPALDGQMDEALQPMMISAVQAANEAIWDSAQVLGTDMGTTCTATLLVGGSLYLAHVGDSRAYLYEPGGLRQLTADHSTVGRLIQLGQLDPIEAREHPLRNQLYRTVGQQPQVMVDFIYQPIGESSHLLICSDGLWGMVEEELILQALNRSPWPQDVCDELIALANLAGGEDNISAVVVTLPRAAR
ncbi:MAG: PP2C family protein-serine/threonine phosphatase [Oscillochloridaceae bacterium umkhey_bin13]